MLHASLETLHLHYDLERPGFFDFERRHYPDKHQSTLSDTVFKPRGRRHVPSPPLEDEQWSPHARHIEPKYSNVGPDWHSRLRYIPSPHNPRAKPTLPVALIEQNKHFMRSYPQNWQRSHNEWIYTTDESADHRPGKRNYFADIHLRSLEDLGDANVAMAKIERKKPVLDSRNGLPKRSDGDKSYWTVELSPGFHKLGSTLPPIDFGRKRKSSLPPPAISSTSDSIPFETKERERVKNELINEVIQLDRWKPAGNIKSAFQVLGVDANDKPGEKYRPRFR